MKTWREAFAYVACLNERSYLGHTDWRVPNRWELRGLLQNDGLECEDRTRLQWLQEQGFSFSSIEGARNLTFFYTSTPIANVESCQLSTEGRPLWAVNLCGEVFEILDVPVYLPTGIWPVRDAEGVRAVAELPATGLSACYGWTGCDRIECAGTGQDGELRNGVVWPSPRFVTNDDTTVTDRLTGMIWAPNGNFPNPDPTDEATLSSWLGALEVIEVLNESRYLGHADWRLPNVSELGTLVQEVEELDLVEVLQGEGLNVKGDRYWSSTPGTMVTEESSQDAAWIVTMRRPGGGGVRLLPFANNRAHLLPVRGP